MTLTAFAPRAFLRPALAAASLLLAALPIVALTQFAA